MIAVRCQSCARRFALFCLGDSDPCPFCGARELVKTPHAVEFEVKVGTNGMTPVLPAVHAPPAMERVTITERTVDIARRLVEQALGTSKESES